MDVFPVIHVISLTEFPRYAMNSCFVRHCLIWKSFLEIFPTQYKRSPDKMMPYNKNTVHYRKTHLASSEQYNELSYDTRTNDGHYKTVQNGNIATKL